jgi:hypothetical protein
MVSSISTHIPSRSSIAVERLTDISSKDSLLTRLASKILSVEQNLKSFVKNFPYAELLKNRVELAEGIVRGAGWSILVWDFCKHASECRRISRRDPSKPENRIKLNYEVKETFVSFVSLSAVTASIVQWADRIRIIALDALAPLLQKFTYAAYLITSGFGIEKAIKTIQKIKLDLSTEKDMAARNIKEHRYRLGVIDLASHITTLAWAILGIVELIVGIAISPLLTGAVVLISCGLAFASFGYSLYIDFKLDPSAASTPPSIEVPA